MHNNGYPIKVLEMKPGAPPHCTIVRMADGKRFEGVRMNIGPSGWQPFITDVLDLMAAPLGASPEQVWAFEDGTRFRLLAFLSQSRWEIEFLQDGARASVTEAVLLDHATVTLGRCT